MREDDDVYQTLIGCALRFVSFRPRSRQELREYLVKVARKKNIGQTMLDRVFSRLEELHYADDAAFTQWFVHSRLSSRSPKGERVIAQELRQKGVSDEIIREKLLHGSKVNSDQKNTYHEALLLLTRKMMRLYQHESPIRGRKKLFDYLMRRGFSSSEIRTVIDECGGKSYNSLKDEEAGEM